MIRTVVLMGTRPEAIKMAPVQRALVESDDFEPILVSTGQHREMLAQVLSVFDLKLDRDLAVMTRNQTLAGLTARLAESIDGMLEEVKPDALLVQGDTTSVMVGALCGFYRNIPVGHVEAGLRTHNMRSPFPEEANRVLASKLVSYHFPPTDGAREHLVNEGVGEQDMVVTGNTVIDALLWESERQRSDETLKASLAAELKGLLEEAGSPLTRLDDREYILITGHRRENFGDGFERICRAIIALAERYPDCRLIYPVHLNPNVNDVVRGILGDRENIVLLPPLHYRLFIHLMSGAKLILTDSGGVQEEAPSLGKPVLVMRDTTERPEGVHAGTVKLVGTDDAAIVTEVSRLMDDPAEYARMSEAQNPYGDGRAASRILDYLRSRLG